MRILFTKRGYAPVGGSESLAYQFATRLATRGHDVRVVCAWPPEREGVHPAADAAHAVFPDHRVFRDHGVEVVQVRPRGGLIGMAADATTLVDLLRTDVLRRYAEGRELIHNIGREYLDSTLAIARERDLPVVLTPLAHPGQFHGGDQPADFDRYRRADIITTLTDWETGWYRANGIDGARLLTTGMGPNAAPSGDGIRFRAAHRIPVDAPLVLYIGRRERYKGYIQLLDSTEAVWQRHPETRFVFIGLQGFYSSFFDEFRRYPDERIIDIEDASAGTKDDALDACDVFAMPSLHETFGLSYLEAWLHGKPVIGGDIPALREVVDEGVDGHLVKQRADLIGSAILGLLDDPVRARGMGVAGRAKVRTRWDWDGIIDRVEHAYAMARAVHPTEALV